MIISNPFIFSFSSVEAARPGVGKIFGTWPTYMNKIAFEIQCCSRFVPVFLKLREFNVLILVHDAQISEVYL